jgi:hypothetical protein
MQEKIADRASILVILLSLWELRAKVVCGYHQATVRRAIPLARAVLVKTIGG